MSQIKEEEEHLWHDCRFVTNHQNLRQEVFYHIATYSVLNIQQNLNSNPKMLIKNNIMEIRVFYNIASYYVLKLQWNLNSTPKMFIKNNIVGCKPTLIIRSTTGPIAF
jgi:hypothetical protein